MEVSKSELLKAYLSGNNETLFKVLQINNDNIIKILSDNITYLDRIPKEYLNDDIYAYFIYKNPTDIFYFIENNVTLKEYHYDIALFKDPALYNIMRNMGKEITDNISDKTISLIEIINNYNTDVCQKISNIFRNVLSNTQESCVNNHVDTEEHKVDSINPGPHLPDHKKVLDAIRESGYIDVNDVVEILKCDKYKARVILRDLVYHKNIKQCGKSRCTYYTIMTSDHTDNIDDDKSKKCKIKIPEYSKIKIYEEEYKILRIHYTITDVVKTESEKKKYIKLIDWMYDCIISGLHISNNMYKNKMIKLKMNDIHSTDNSFNMNRTLLLVNDNVPILDRSLYVDEKHANEIIDYAKQGFDINKIYKLLKDVKGCNKSVITNVLAKYDIDLLRRATARDKFIISRIIYLFIENKNYISDIRDTDKIYMDKYKDDDINIVLLRNNINRARRRYKSYSEVLG